MDIYLQCRIVVNLKAVPQIHVKESAMLCSRKSGGVLWRKYDEVVTFFRERELTDEFAVFEHLPESLKVSVSLHPPFSNAYLCTFEVTERVGSVIPAFESAFVVHMAQKPRPIVSKMPGFPVLSPTATGWASWIQLAESSAGFDFMLEMIDAALLGVPKAISQHQ